MLHFKSFVSTQKKQMHSVGELIDDGASAVSIVASEVVLESTRPHILSNEMFKSAESDSRPFSES